MPIPALITVRSASSRLPEKCLLPFGDGAVLDHVIRRALHYGLGPIVCTTHEPGDDRITAIAKAHGVPCFRGAVRHKLKRWADCCAAFDIAAFHTVDADDPFFDGDEMARSFAMLKDEGLDMVCPSPSSSAGGASVGYSLTRSIVDRAVALTAADDDTEMMWYWIDKVEGLKKAVLPEAEAEPVTVRLTLDYAEDYWLLASVLRIAGPLAPRPEIDGLFRRNPDLYKVNWFRNDEWAAGQAARKI